MRIFKIILLGTLMFHDAVECQPVGTSKKDKYLLVQIEEDGENDVGIGVGNEGNVLA